jgi:phosphoribosylamine-glycine ligase
VVNLTGIASDPRTAIARAYEAVRRVEFDGAHYRTDIGVAALAQA